jgi:hypothetical protein
MPSPRLAHISPRVRWTVATLVAAALGTAALLAGCPRHIGDGCSINTDCSLQGDRVCDITQLGGYCTIPECSPDSCPDNAMCVEFQAGLTRTARRYCVNPCNTTSDCRGQYQCVHVNGAQGPVGDAGCPRVDPASGAMPPECSRIIDTDAGHTGYCVQQVM